MILTEGKSFQQVIDEIADKLEAQGKQCISEDGFCLYSDGKGNHCAAGWLLPDDADFEGSIWSVIYNYDHLGVNTSFIKTHVEDLGEVQSIHDVASKGSKVRLEEKGYNVDRLFKICSNPTFQGETN